MACSGLGELPEVSLQGLPKHEKEEGGGEAKSLRACKFSSMHYDLPIHVFFARLLRVGKKPLKLSSKRERKDLENFCLALHCARTTPATLRRLVWSKKQKR